MGTIKITRLESYEAFLKDASTLITGCYKTDSSSWSGESFKKALDKATNGDDSAVTLATPLLDEINAAIGGEALQTWQAAPMGAYPVVPEFLAGIPFNMRARCESEDVSPANIYVNVGTSQALSAENVTARGVAILALILKLQQIRPVTLWLTTERELNGAYDGACILVVPMQSNPISISHVANALTSPGFARRLMYGINDYHGAGDDWAFGVWTPVTDEYRARIAEVLELTPNDLYIGTGHQDYPEIFRNPLAWVNTQLARFNNEVE